jgi:hypothetical protein
MFLGVYILIRLDVHSWWLRLGFAIPIAFVGAWSRDVLNASFGRFQPVQTKPNEKPLVEVVDG